MWPFISAAAAVVAEVGRIILLFSRVVDALLAKFNDFNPNFI